MTTLINGTDILRRNSCYICGISVSSIPLVTSCKGGPLLLSGHRLLDAIVVPIVPGVAVTVTMAATLRQRELSVPLPPSLLTQLVPVVLNV